LSANVTCTKHARVHTYQSHGKPADSCRLHNFLSGGRPEIVTFVCLCCRCCSNRQQLAYWRTCGWSGEAATTASLEAVRNACGKRTSLCKRHRTSHHSLRLQTGQSETLHACDTSCTTQPAAGRLNMADWRAGVLVMYEQHLPNRMAIAHLPRLLPKPYERQAHH
jgi:hypothetical protein